MTIAGLPLAFRSGDAGQTLLAAGAVLALLASLWRIESNRPDELVPADTTSVIAGEIETLKDAAWLLGEQEMRYRDLLDSQSELIVRRDTRGNITFANRAYCRAFGLDPSAVVGTQHEPKPAEDAGPAVVPLGQPAGTNRRVTRVTTASGPRWIEWDAHAVVGHGAVEDEAQLVGRDVTDQLAAEEQLARARDEAQAASRAKSRFLAAMSHEIRTPMSGILGMASLLLDSQQSAEQRTYTEAVDTSARTLLALIDEILDFSKIEAGRLELSSAPFSMLTCVQNSVELLAPRAHERGLELAWSIDPAMPALLDGDESRVRQILMNLIGNAVKFTDRGGIVVEVLRGSAGPDGATTVIRIKDTGIGVSAETAERLFAEFSQSDAPEARERGGTGLGLAISRRLARAMGGDITLDSAPGRGATFTFEVALRPVDGAGPAIATTAPTRHRPRVLLAFNRQIERRAMAAVLRTFGVSAVERDVDEIGSDGTSEPETDWASEQDGEPFDLVIVDSQLSPSEAAGILRAEQDRHGVMPKGVSIVDSLSRTRVDAYRAVGFESYLVRPVRPQSLLAQVGLTTSLTGSDPDAVARPQAGVDLGLRVLLAEDNPINALLAERMLASVGCKTVRAVDGLAAIEAVEVTYAGREPPYDVILMDVHMPRLDGLRAAAALKRLSRAVPVPPVIALTANAFREDREACLAAGYDDYLSKPFSKDELVEVLKRWCLTARGQAA